MAKYASQQLFSKQVGRTWHAFVDPNITLIYADFWFWRTWAKALQNIGFGVNPFGARIVSIVLLSCVLGIFPQRDCNPSAGRAGNHPQTNT